MGKFDFRQVVPRKKNMLDPVGTVSWDSYSMELVSLAEVLMTQVSEDAIAQKYPKYLRLEPFAEEPRSIIGVPVMEEGPDTVPVKYFAKAKSVVIDLSRFFMVEPLHIPRGNRAYIAISRKQLPELGHCLLLHFGKAEFKAIEERKKKGQGSAPAVAQAQPQAQTQVAPGTDSAAK